MYFFMLCVFNSKSSLVASCVICSKYSSISSSFLGLSSVREPIDGIWCFLTKTSKLLYNRLYETCVLPMNDAQYSLFWINFHTFSFSSSARRFIFFSTSSWPPYIALSSLIHGKWKHVCSWDFEKTICSTVVGHANRQLLYERWQIHQRDSAWYHQVLILYQVSMCSSPLMQKMHSVLMLRVVLPLSWKPTTSLPLVHSRPLDTKHLRLFLSHRPS